MRRHYEPEGVFQKSILAKYKEESDANLKAIQLDYEKHMRCMEQDYAERIKFWEDSDRELNTKFQVCNCEWS